MNEKEVLISHCLDIKKQALDNFMITSTNFLSVDERNVILKTEREFSADIDTFYYGGYDESERNVAVYVPKPFDVSDIGEYYRDNPDECPFCLIKISKDRFSKLTHRDYLGSLMGLGIKRETIGDIVVSEESCFVFALKSISDYICENLCKAGRGTLSCEITDLSSFSVSDENTETVFSSVASLRLDNIVASAFNLSRSSASEVIKGGLVYINSIQNFKCDSTVKEKDKIVLRGRGKVILDNVIGESKKGRTHVNLKKFK